MSTLFRIPIVIITLFLCNGQCLSAQFKTLTITENTTPRGVYEQLGVPGLLVSDSEFERDPTYSWDIPMIVYYYKDRPITICKSGCDGTAIYITFEEDNKRSSVFQKIFPGIFGKEYKLSTLNPVSIEY